MDWNVAKIGTYSIYHKPAHAIGLSTPPIGCVLDFPGLPGGGNKIYDRSLYVNHGTIIGAVWERLPSGLWVLSFDGLDDYVEIPDTDALDFGTGEFTIDGWFNTRRPSNEYPTFITSQGGFPYSFGIRHDNMGSLLRVSIHWYSEGDPVLVSTNTFAIQTWHRFAVTRSGTALILYVNGSNEGTATVSAASSVDLCLGGSARIGRATWDVARGYYKGRLGIIRAYNRALSALEIQNHYRQEKHLFGVV